MKIKFEKLVYNAYGVILLHKNYKISIDFVYDYFYMLFYNIWNKMPFSYIRRYLYTFDLNFSTDMIKTGTYISIGPFNFYYLEYYK